MALTRTYSILVGDPQDPELTQTIEVTTDNEASIYRLAYAQVEPGVDHRARVLESHSEGRDEPDLREYRKLGEDGRNALPERTVRARSVAEAEQLAGGPIGSSSRVSDAQLVVEATGRETHVNLSVEEVIESLGLSGRYVDEPDNEHGVPEHFVFEDGSVTDVDAERAHEDVSDWSGEIGDAAQERLNQAFHAGDSGFRDPESDVQRAHAERQELRSKDNVRPVLSSGAPAPTQAETDHDGPSHSL